MIGLLVLSFTLPATAAPAPPTGTFNFEGSAGQSVGASLGISYGDSVTFATTVDGKVSKQARIYVTLVCLGTDSDAAYQWSKWDSVDGVYSFDLVDQAGQGLDWFAGQDAFCEAWLIHRVQKGKAAEITVLDSFEFSVNG